MTKAYPKLGLRIGDTVTFDGETWKIKERSTDDIFVVQTPTGGTDLKHVDWFMDMSYNSQRIVINKEN